MRLDQILSEAKSIDVEISGIACDSRHVQQGNVFVAISGSNQDGSAYIDAAIAKGAVAIVSDKPYPASLTNAVPYIKVLDARIALSQMSAQFYAGQPQTIVAITGTSGKSSVAEFVRQIFAKCGHQAACVGTLGITTDHGIEYGTLTTPDAVSLHKTLQSLHQQGVTHLAMEASSHGIEQHRLDGVKLAVCAFLNLGRDHLDYHQTMDAYFAAKMKLFDMAAVSKSNAAVVNLDGERGEQAAQYARDHGLNVVTVGKQAHDVTLIHSEQEKFSQKLTIEYQQKRFDVVLPLIGEFQTQNALMAAGIVIATGEPAEKVIPLIATLTGVKGRLEQVAISNGAMIVIDYAHKPEALMAVLDTLRPYTTGQLVCVMGCGGDRDAGKRPIMGEIAANKADIVIVTDDNPRTEDPEKIRAAIISGMKNTKNVFNIADRRHAIETAITMVKAGDILIIAGKGHETGQIIGQITLPFSDHDVVQKAVTAR